MNIIHKKKSETIWKTTQKKTGHRACLLVFSITMLFLVSLSMYGCSSKTEKSEVGVVHVTTTGSDKNDGSSIKKAFKTIQYAIDSFEEKGGGTILIHEGTYHERLFVGEEHSGTADFPLVIKSAEETKPAIIDGSPLPAEKPYSVNPKEYNYRNEVGQIEMINIECADYVRIEGLEICNNSTPHSGWEATAGILITAFDDKGSTGVEIINNKIYNIDGETWGYRAYETEGKEYSCDMNGHGIAAYGEGDSEETAIEGLKIIGNEVYDNKVGQSETVVVNGNVKHFEIKQNFVHDNNNIGIAVIGGEETSENMHLDSAREGRVEGNLVTGNFDAANQTYDIEGGCDGIYIDGGRDNFITNNYIIGSDYCLEIGVETDLPFPRASGNKVTNNLFLDGDISGLLVGSTYGAKGNTISNNSVYSSSPYEVERNREKKTPNIFVDNIFAATDSEFDWVLSPDKKTAADGFVFDKNVYFGGSKPDGKKHKNVIRKNDKPPYEDTGNGEFKRFNLPLLKDKGADVDKIKGAMEADGFLMNKASLFEIAKANYVARTEMKPKAEKVEAALKTAKGTRSNPLTPEQIGGKLTDYLLSQSGGPPGTVVCMKHSGVTGEGGTKGEALNSIEDGKGKYFGMIQIGRGEDGKIKKDNIKKDNIKKAQTLTNIRIYYKVPYTYSVKGAEYTGWLGGQINGVCVDFGSKTV